MDIRGPALYIYTMVLLIVAHLPLSMMTNQYWKPPRHDFAFTAGHLVHALLQIHQTIISLSIVLDQLRLSAILFLN